MMLSGGKMVDENDESQFCSVQLDGKKIKWKEIWLSHSENLLVRSLDHS